MRHILLPDMRAVCTRQNRNLYVSSLAISGTPVPDKATFRRFAVTTISWVEQDLSRNCTMVPPTTVRITFLKMPKLAHRTGSVTR